MTRKKRLRCQSRICLMNSGGIEQIGTPSDLYFHPRTIFAADLWAVELADATLLSSDNRNADQQAITRAKIKATLGQEIATGQREILFAGIIFAFSDQASRRSTSSPPASATEFCLEM